MTATVHAADLVLTMSGDETTADVIRDGAVLVEGALVTDVGTREEVVRRAGARARVRVWRGVLLPGLVNAHTHLGLGPGFGDLAELATAGLTVEQWRSRVQERVEGMGPDEGRVEVRGSVHAALRTGTTCVGEVDRSPAPSASPPGGLAGRYWRSGPGGACDLDPGPGGVEADDVEADDVEAGSLEANGGAVAKGRAAGPGGAESPVVVRTRSAAVLRIAEPPVAELVGAGRLLAIGTESLASVPDLDLLAEARACRDLASRQGLPGTGAALLTALTTGGAAALGVDAGTITPGRRADLTVIDLHDLHDLVGHVGSGARADLAVVAEALIAHGAGRCVATVLAGRLVHRRA